MTHALTNAFKTFALCFFELVKSLKSEPWVDELDAYVLKQVAADRFSGCILVAQGDTPIFRKAYGFASKRFKVPNQVDTKFNLGSITKVFTKVAVMQLAERHKLSLEDYISEYLQNYPPDTASKITINHLLSHTSGMGNYFNEKFEASKDKLRTVDDFMSLFLNDPLSFKPGEKMQYSNNGYVVLGKIVESISGQDYYDYVREHIYRPAGMSDSDHYETDSPVPNLAIGHTRMHNQPYKLVGGSWRENALMIGIKGSPAGGGYSTADDLLRFSIALRSHKLLNQEHTDLVYHQPSPAGTSQAEKPRAFGVAGGAPGIGAALKMYLDTAYVNIILSNHDPEDMQVIRQKTEDIILHECQ
jgi:CubicO group peptidase (beta-lactamase class C family)